jgi:hypothetical protein
MTTVSETNVVAVSSDVKTDAVKKTISAKNAPKRSDAIGLIRVLKAKMAAEGVTIAEPTVEQLTPDQVAQLAKNGRLEVKDGTVQMKGKKPAKAAAPTPAAPKPEIYTREQLGSILAAFGRTKNLLFAQATFKKMSTSDLVNLILLCGAPFDKALMPHVEAPQSPAK